MAKRSYSNDRSLNYGHRLHEHNLICNDQNSLFPPHAGAPNSNANYRNRSPLMMQFKQDPRNSRAESPVSGEELEELNENEQFYHLKKLLSNANLQNNKNYQYAKSKSSKRNATLSSESIVVDGNNPTSRNRSPMLSKRSETLQPTSQSSGIFKARPLRTTDDRRSNHVPVTGSCNPPAPVSNGRY